MQGENARTAMRILERKNEMPSSERTDAQKRADAVHGCAKVARDGKRQSNFPVSSGGMNQESDHNKHNHQTQQGHKPPMPEPAHEKQD